MKNICSLFVLLTIISTYVHGGFIDSIKRGWAKYCDGMEDKKIELGYCEKYIRKPLPPDFIPSKDPKCRTPET